MSTRLAVTSTARVQHCQNMARCMNDGQCYYDPVLKQEMCRCPQSYTGTSCEMPVRGMWLFPCPTGDATECPEGGLCVVEPLMNQRLCIYNVHHIDTVLALAREEAAQCETKTNDEMMTSHARLYTLLGMVIGLCALVGVVVGASVLGWRHRKKRIAKRKSKKTQPEKCEKDKMDTVVTANGNDTETTVKLRSTKKLSADSQISQNSTRDSTRKSRNQFFPPSASLMRSRDRLQAQSESKSEINARRNSLPPAKVCVSDPEGNEVILPVVKNRLRATLQRGNSVSSSDEQDKPRSRPSSPRNRPHSPNNLKHKRSFSEHGPRSSYNEVPSFSIDDGPRSDYTDVPSISIDEPDVTDSLLARK